MKPIKKFSTEMNQPKSILESIDSKALDELIKGMGFKDIHELKREKNLLSKLEALLKEVNPKQDISEDDAEEIEDDIKKKGEPKSLEDVTGEKEPETPVGKPEEIEEEEESEESEDKEETEEESDEDEVEGSDDKEGSEDKAEVEVEVEVDDTSKDSTEAEPHAEPDADDKGGESDGDADNEDEEEVEAEEESAKTPKASRKIMTFEDFIQEETKTINKNVSYKDDDEEKEDYALPVADSKDNEMEVEENRNTSKSGVKSFSQFVSEAYADKGPELKDEETSADSVAVPVTPGDGSKTAAAIADETVKTGKPEELKDEEGKKLVTKDQEITEEPKTSKDEVETQGKVVVKESLNEAEIKSDEEFKEYAMTVLKKAFGDKFDETKAGETADGLISKYKGDYGAMVGALQSGLDK